ncbi:ATP-binding protein [Saccharothrix sp. S26]|uniref:ATP-binding protein n=1 Tax=Saccharothrix sp. S26 TaxID=2907215 RepID=UPI001F45E847|nr:ATP-binding protein [Saccharothrix sp. S26]MCE6995520.1 ATP-binding protein [Saccharothrix sp. S26]
MSTTPPPTHHTSHLWARAPGTSLLELSGRPPLVEVRRWTAAMLSRLDADVLDDVVMVVNELVANAYDHTAAPVRLHVLLTDGYVHVAVEDGSMVPPTPRGWCPSGTRGRGLLLIEELAVAWGSTPGPAGKTVWAHLTDTAPPADDQV